MNVATQMGNQGHSFDSARRMVEIVRDGVIGHVREVHCWTDRPGHYWRQPVHRPPSARFPARWRGILWLGPAPFRPFTGYKGVDDKKLTYYVPHDWRGWWDFGSGALGDMACHLVDTVYWALELGAPVSAEATAEGATAESAPAWQIIRYEFPERPSKSRGTLPPTTLTWYDGGKRPPKALAEGIELGRSGDDNPFPINGTLWIGDKGRIFTADEYSSAYVLYPRDKFADYKGPAITLPRNPITAGQRAPYVEWIAACKGGPMSLSNFEYASRLTEAMLVGVLSARLGKKIEWDGENMRATNAPEAEPLIKREYRKGWTV